MIDYRTFQTADIEEVLDMWKNTPGVRLHENGEDSPEGVKLCLCRGKGLSFVALENGSIVGAVLSGQDGRRGYIYHLVVKQSHRRRGIASRLLSLTEAAMKDSGIHKLALFVLNENVSAQAFYNAVGWSEENVVRVFSRII